MGISKLAAPSAWTHDWTLGPGLANLFDLYPSRGDVTIGAATNLATDLDGPSKVFRYGALTINAELSITNRARPPIILCDSLAMGAAGKFVLDSLGARGESSWPSADWVVPQILRLRGKAISLRDVLAAIAAAGIFVGDPVFWALREAELGDCTGTIVSALGAALIAAAGCAPGGEAQRAPNPTYNSQCPGNGGFAGANAPGGGAGGGAGSGGTNQSGYGGRGGQARPWSGGGAATGAYEGIGLDAWPFGGPGANGLRPGGSALILCRGDVALADGHQWSAKGEDGTTAYYGAPGGGRIGLIHAGALTGVFNGTAAGGVNSGTYGANGGDGVADCRTFAQMGWS